MLSNKTSHTNDKHYVERENGSKHFQMHLPYDALRHHRKDLIQCKRVIAVTFVHSRYFTLLQDKYTHMQSPNHLSICATQMRKNRMQLFMHLSLKEPYCKRWPLFVGVEVLGIEPKGALSLSYIPNSLYFQTGSRLPSLALNMQSTCLHLLNPRDYRYVPLHPATFSYLITIL